MPSPFAHLAAGYAVYRLVRSRLPQRPEKDSKPASALLFLSVGISMLPDADAAFGLVAGDLGRFHNAETHSLIVGLCVALLVSAFAFWRWRPSALAVFLVSALSYSAHVLMDAATNGRGVMAFWPLTSERLISPIQLFYGLHWGNGPLSVWHLWTVATELASVVMVALVVVYVLRRGERKGDGPCESA